MLYRTYEEGDDYSLTLTHSLADHSISEWPSLATANYDVILLTRPLSELSKLKLEQYLFIQVTLHVTTERSLYPQV